MVRESISLNRTPIVFKPQFDSCHNFDIDVDSTWDKYLDLNYINIIHASTGKNFSIKAISDNDIYNYDDLSILWIERDHVVTDKENEYFDLIIRHNRTGLEIDGIHNGVRGITDYTVKFLPSKLVLDIYTQVSNKIENYCAIHVRSGDMLKMVDLYPNLDDDTQPEKIRSTLLGFLPKHSKIYILTNEQDKNYFNPLKTDFEVLQYFDFPELKDIVENEQPDNFLLFEIEKLLFENANTKIYTFTHPEGGIRKSLSRDLGWA